MELSAPDALNQVVQFWCSASSCEKKETQYVRSQNVIYFKLKAIKNILKNIEWYFNTCEERKNIFNLLTPNDGYSGRTAPLTSKRCILYIYSTNTGTEYFKHGIYSRFFFPLQNAVCFINLTYLVPVLFTFYIQGVLKLKKK